MKVPLSPVGTISDFMNSWIGVRDQDPLRYTTDITVVNTGVKIDRTFPKTASIRKKKRILMKRTVRAKREPRTRVFHNCYPVATSG